MNTSACWQGTRHGLLLLLILGGAAVFWRSAVLFSQPDIDLPPIEIDTVEAEPAPVLVGAKERLRSDAPQAQPIEPEKSHLLHPTPRQRRYDPHDPKHFATSADGSKPMPRLAMRMCSHLLMQMGTYARDGPKLEDCAFFETADTAELEALDDHTFKHKHKSRSAAGNSLCGVVHKVLLDHQKTIQAVSTAPEPMHAATVKSECEGLFSHQSGTHYGVFKSAFVLNKVDL